MNQPQGKSKATEILGEALGAHIKTQQLIIEMEGDSGLIASLPEYCDCDPDHMKPSNTADRVVGSYWERLCLNCDLWISMQHMDNFNRAHGFSGYDEFNDHDVEPEDD